MSTLGFVNVYNIGGFFANPGLRYVFPTIGVPEPEPEEVEEPGYIIYTVVSGDSLYRIARTHLGAGNRWGEIFELNRDVITNPRLIHIGWQLRIPA